MASLVAKQGGVPRTIVRIEAEELRSRASAELRQTFGADLVIDPDHQTGGADPGPSRLPGASEIAVMAQGEVIVKGARLEAGAPIVGRRLSELAAEYEPDWEFMVGSISRGENTYMPRADYMLLEDEPGPRGVQAAGPAAGGQAPGSGHRHGSPCSAAGRWPHRGDPRGPPGVEGRGGGGSRARPGPGPGAGRRSRRRQVFEGDITDADLLEEADIGRFDAVAALTGEDEANILACLYAKSVGASETIAVVHKLALLSLLDSAGVDVALSPRTATADGVMRFVRGDVAAVATFLQSDAEVLELEVAPDSPADGTW